MLGPRIRREQRHHRVRRVERGAARRQRARRRCASRARQLERSPADRSNPRQRWRYTGARCQGCLHAVSQHAHLAVKLRPSQEPSGVSGIQLVRLLNELCDADAPPAAAICHDGTGDRRKQNAHVRGQLHRLLADASAGRSKFKKFRGPTRGAKRRRRKFALSAGPGRPARIRNSAGRTGILFSYW